MRIARELLDAGIYTNNVDERGEIDVRTLNIVHDNVKLCLLNSNNGIIKKEDCIIDGRIIDIQTAIRTAAEREGKEKAEKVEKQRIEHENLRKASEELLQLVENWDYSHSPGCHFKTKPNDAWYDLVAWQGECTNAYNGERHIPRQLPSDIAAKIKQKFDLAKAYHQQIEKRAKELVEQRVSKAISEELKKLYDGPVYKRVGPKFERIN